MLANFEHLKSTAHRDIQDMTDRQPDELIHEQTMYTICPWYTMHQGINTTIDKLTLAHTPHKQTTRQYLSAY